MTGMVHSCDAEIRASDWAMSGYRQDGDRWTCSCGERYIHECDEADGCTWLRIIADCEPIVLREVCA